MHSRNLLYVPLLLLAALASLIGCARCNPTYADASAANAPSHQNTLLAEVEGEVHGNGNGNDGGGDPANYDKRVERYAFGLGRRAYTYTNGGNGMKRLPVYNFGLGKRARPYSFGLGKRAEYDEDQYDGDYEHSNNLNANAYNAGFMDEKRNRPYSFGLGKRDAMDDVARRGYPNRYGFGLGRR